MPVDKDTQQRWNREDTDRVLEVARRIGSTMRELRQVEQDEPSILEEALSIVENKSRDYGKPADNANRIACLWGTYLDGKYGNTLDWDITADDVCMMMVLLKIARRVQTPSRDSLVDIAGWAAVAEQAGEGS